MQNVDPQMGAAAVATAMKNNEGLLRPRMPATMAAVETVCAATVIAQEAARIVAAQQQQMCPKSSKHLGSFL